MLSKQDPIHGHRIASRMTKSSASQPAQREGSKRLLQGREKREERTLPVSQIRLLRISYMQVPALVPQSCRKAAREGVQQASEGEKRRTRKTDAPKLREYATNPFSRKTSGLLCAEMIMLSGSPPPQRLRCVKETSRKGSAPPRPPYETAKGVRRGTHVEQRTSELPRVVPGGVVWSWRKGDVVGCVSGGGKDDLVIESDGGSAREARENR